MSVLVSRSVVSTGCGWCLALRTDLSLSVSRIFRRRVTKTKSLISSAKSTNTSILVFSKVCGNHILCVDCRAIRQSAFITNFCRLQLPDLSKQCNSFVFHDYLIHGGGYALDAVRQSFVLSVCGQDYCKSNQPISLKLGSMIGSTNRKN